LYWISSIVSATLRQLHQPCPTRHRSNPPGFRSIKEALNNGSSSNIGDGGTDFGEEAGVIAEALSGRNLPLQCRYRSSFPSPSLKLIFFPSDQPSSC
jgi:hypothetical protein